jgi:hypothetical protein
VPPASTAVPPAAPVQTVVPPLPPVTATPMR